MYYIARLREFDKRVRTLEVDLFFGGAGGQRGGDELWFRAVDWLPFIMG